MWLAGWLLFMLGYYINEVYILKNIHKSKSLIAYEGFKTGSFSWIAIFLVIIYFIVLGLAIIDEKITDKIK